MIIAIIAVVFLLLLSIGIYNSLVVKRNNVDNAFAAIDANLKKRYDLIPNLVETVKTYMQHESSTFARITELRAQAATAAGTEKAAIADETGRIMRNIMVQVENYPELKASENFQHLQRTLTEIEEQLSASRRSFNAAVTELNNAIEIFPSSLFAAVFGFSKRQLFEISEAERANVNVGNIFRS